MLINPKYDVLPAGTQELMSDPDIQLAVRTATAQAKQRQDTTEICQTNLEHHYLCRDTLSVDNFYLMVDSLESESLKNCCPKDWRQAPANPDHIINNWLRVSNALLTQAQIQRKQQLMDGAMEANIDHFPQLMESVFNYMLLKQQHAAEIKTKKQYHSKYWKALWGIYSAWIKSAVEANVMDRWDRTQPGASMWEFPESAGVK